MKVRVPEQCNVAPCARMRTEQAASDEKQRTRWSQLKRSDRYCLTHDSR
jgi:hypothetical protein